MAVPLRAMSTLGALLAAFESTSAEPNAGPEQPFGFEPFALPVRAFAHSLSPFGAEVRLLEAMDADPLPPQWIERLVPLNGTGVDTATLAESGANATTQLAALLRHLATLPQSEQPTLTWRCGFGRDFWENMALVRAGKALVLSHFETTGQAVFVLKVEACALAAAMTEADGYSNLLRLSQVALSAHTAGVDSVYLPEFAKEAKGLESLRERIDQVVAHESRVHSYAQGQKGAYWPTLLAAKMMLASRELAASGQDLAEIAAQTLAEKRQAVASGKRVWVGQTAYTNNSLTVAGPAARATAEWAA